MTYARKVDSNQPEVVKAFRAMGCSVKHNHASGKGAPDLMVGYGGLTALVEVKAEKGDLNEVQRKWLDDWTGGHYVVRGMSDVHRIVSMLRNWHKTLSDKAMQ